jgi:hypothetical protein
MPDREVHRLWFAEPFAPPTAFRITNYHFSELKQSKYEKIIERPTGMLIELALPASE